MHAPSELLPIVGELSQQCLSVCNPQGQLQLIPVYSMDSDAAHFVFRAPD